MTRILVIEDDTEVLDNIIDTLGEARYDVQGAVGGLQGLQVAREHIPDLVICDILMPDISGYDVLRVMRQEAVTATVPFVFLTAKTEREDLRKGMELGADDYITKPFTQAELLRAISAQLRKHGAYQQQHRKTLDILRANITYALPHEIRTPLNLIMGYAEVLDMDCETVKPDLIRDAARQILGAGMRMHRLLENYLVYAQIEVLAADPDQRDALRRHITADSDQIITRQAAHVAARHNRQEDLSLALCQAALRISEQNLGKIVDEMVDNAFKFSEAGRPVEVQSTVEGGYFVLSIRDYGQGIATEDLKRIGAYMQFERAIYEQKGLGLGFVIAKRLIELHGGKLGVRSSRRQGTLIGIRFPI